MSRYLCLVLLIAACSKSGEHQSRVAICDASVRPAHHDPATFDRLHAALRDRLVAASFQTCTRKARRAYQLGARPIEWYCGRIGTADVLATINRPGERDCELELDLRADVAGTEAKIADVELPIIAFRDDVKRWFEGEMTSQQQPGLGMSVSAGGAWLGDVQRLPAH